MIRQGARAAAIAAGMTFAVIVLLAAARLIAGDLIAIPTAPPLVPNAKGEVFCHLARAEGRLVAHPDWGLALQPGPNPPDPIVWPHGYAGRIAGNGVELLDHRGGVIARTGDTIEMAGGQATVEGVQGFRACPLSIRIIAAQP